MNAADRLITSTQRAEPLAAGVWATFSGRRHEPLLPDRLSKRRLLSVAKM